MGYAGRLMFCIATMGQVFMLFHESSLNLVHYIVHGVPHRALNNSSHIML